LIRGSVGFAVGFERLPWQLPSFNIRVLDMPDGGVFIERGFTTATRIGRICDEHVA